MKHQEIIEALPWYVNGTLSQTERAAVVQHLDSGCQECAREVASLTAIRRLVVAVGDEAPEPSPLLLDRALAEIEDYESTRSDPKNLESSPSWLGALRESWWPKTPVFARMALAAQLALLLALGGVAIYQHTHPEIVYKTASGPSAVKPGQAMISVVFNEKASERDIRQTIQEIHGTIIDGPSPQGSYTVQLPIRSEQTAELDQVLQTLLRKPQVVTSALEKQ
jgi:anti-sigma factor RsiW